MSKLKKNILLFFFLLLIYDLYDCTKTGLEVSIWLRPAQMIVLCLFVFQKRLPLLVSLLIGISLLITSINEHIFYSTGLTHQNELISLLLIKNFCFIVILQKSINKRQLSLKFFRWIFTYIIIAISICALLIGSENWYYYILAIELGLILFLISLQIKDLALFRQMYLGFTLMILALIFGKIIVTDFRWFVEVIIRLALVFGHLFFISALVDIKLMPKKSNTLDYQTVK